MLANNDIKIEIIEQDEKRKKEIARESEEKETNFKRNSKLILNKYYKYVQPNAVKQSLQVNTSIYCHI